MFCQSCGGKIDDGERFCTSCGKAVNSAPVSQAIPPQYPVQAVQSSENKQILKQGPLSYDENLIKAVKGVATLYNDRLEWTSEKRMGVVIMINEILSTEISTVKQCLTINLVNSKKHNFSKPITAGDVAKHLAFGYMGSGGIIAELSEWKSAIDVARGRS